MKRNPIKHYLFSIAQTIGVWLVSITDRRPATMAEVFGENGIFAQSPTFEFRAPQLEIAEEIFGALGDQQHLLAEAGTGTGKTLAYLVPAIIHAQSTKSPVVVATGTKQLQDQIGDKDIPFLRKMLPFKFTSVILKGVSNYACLQKIRTARSKNNTPALSNLEAKLKTAQSGGEWNELDYAGSDRQQLAVSRSKCDSCNLQSVCPFIKLINDARHADVVITNHHNWLSSEKAQSFNNIPRHKTVIFDEAHLLESTATNIFTNELKQTDFTFLGRAAADKRFDFTRALILNTEESVQQIAKISKAPQPSTADIYIELNIIESLVKQIVGKVEQCHVRSAQGFLNQLYYLQNKIAQLLEHQNSDDFILSIKTPADGFSLQSIPIETQGILRKIFAQKVSAVFVSATLSAGGNFEFSHYFLGLEKEKTREAQTGSPFDYAAQGLLYTPNLCDPRAKEFIAQATAEIVKLTELSEGRAFVLCTSKANAETLYNAVKERTSYPCLLQGENNIPTNELVHRFKETPNAILFGTSTFWQGVDVQGSQLSCVIIDRLPFAVPTDTAFIARAAKLQAKGKNAFFNYSLPQAVIQLNQGVGRLLRSMNDTGIVCILDSRVTQSKYSEYILSNLPNFTRTNELGKAADFIQDKTQTTEFLTMENAPEASAAYQMTTDEKGDIIF